MSFLQKYRNRLKEHANLENAEDAKWHKKEHTKAHKTSKRNEKKTKYQKNQEKEGTSTKFLLKTCPRLLRQVKNVPFKYPINTIFYELSKQFDKQEMLIRLLPALLRENKMIDKESFAEQLFNHYYPFLLSQKEGVLADFVNEEKQCNVLCILQFAMFNYPQDIETTFYEKGTKYIFKLIELICGDTCTISVNAWRCLFNIFNHVFNVINNERKLELLENVTNQMMLDVKDRRMLINFLASIKGANFDIANYFSARIIKSFPMEQIDYDVLLEEFEKGTVIAYPFNIVRNALQSFVYCNTYQRITYEIIKRSLSYFKTCRRLRNWTTTFFKRAFQWLYVAHEMGKYKERSKYVTFQLRRLYDLKIPGMKDIIQSSAVSLISVLPRSYASKCFHFPNVLVDPTFMSDLKGLFFSAATLKKKLIWPQEKLYKDKVVKKIAPMKVVKEGKHKDENESDEEYYEEDEELSLPEVPEERIQVPKTKPVANDTDKKVDVYFNVIDSSYVDLASYISFDPSAIKYEGKGIRIRGFAVLESPFLPDGDWFLIGKYGTNCCAADSSFAGWYAKYDLSKVEKDKWYQVEGIIREGKDKDGLQIMYVDVVSMEEIDGNKEEQYVWPCYTYDDGKCSEIQKYNLEY